MVIMCAIYHIAIRRERRVGTKNEKVTGATDSQRSMMLGSSVAQPDKLAQIS